MAAAKKSVRLVTAVEEGTPAEAAPIEDAQAEATEETAAAEAQAEAAPVEDAQAEAAEETAVAEAQAEAAPVEDAQAEATEEIAAAESHAEAARGPYLRITLVKSGTGYKYDQKRTLVALGLRRLNVTVERPDNPSVRGMLNKVQHLVRVEEIGQS